MHNPLRNAGWRPDVRRLYLQRFHHSSAMRDERGTTLAALRRGAIMASGRRWIFVAVMAWGLATPAAPQSLYGSLVGTVTDETGAAIPGATVTVTQAETNLSRSAATDETGSYNVPNLLPGTYESWCRSGLSRDHDHDNLPTVITGRGNGAFHLGRHVTYPKETPLANLHVAMLNQMGIPAEKFADSTGRLGSLSDR
jgi:hypothetical protein